MNKSYSIGSPLQMKGPFAVLPLRRHLDPLHPLGPRLSLPDRIRNMHRGIGLARHEIAIARLSPHVAFLPRNPPARQDEARHAGAGEALEHIVFDARYLLLGGDRLGRLRIPDDKVGA